MGGPPKIMPRGYEVARKIMKSPLVSVVIPTYNQPKLLAETLESVFAQTMTDREIVVVNDGSTDDTAEHLKTYGDRVRAITQPNGGIGAARNRGIDESTGKYVALLDHDDLWHPDKLAAQTEFMASHPDCTGCSVAWEYSTAPGRCVFSREAVADEDGIIHRPLLHLARGQVFLISSSILFDREKASGLRYVCRRQCIEDTPFQIGLLTRGPFGIAGSGIAGDKILMTYRWHAANYSSQASFFYNGVQMLRDMQRENFFEPLTDEQRNDLEQFLSHLARSAVVHQLLGGTRTDALSLYLKEMRHQLTDGRFKFLATTPLLAALPKSLLRRRWDSQIK